MRTRSQTSAKNSIVEILEKREKGDDCAVHEHGAGRKRQRVQSRPDASDKGISAAGRLCSPRAKKSSPGKRRKSVKSAQDDGASNKQTHEAFDQEMTRFNPEIAEVPCTAPTTCREDDNEITSGSLTGGRTSSNTPILDLHAMVVKSSTAEAFKSRNKRDNSDTMKELGPMSAQNHSIEQCSPFLEKNLHKDGNSVQPPQEYLLEQNIAICEEPTHLQSQSAPKRKQLNNSRRTNTVPMPMKAKKPNLKGIRAAKLRWMHLVQSIINAKTSPGCTSVDNKLPHSGVEQTMTVDICPSNETQSLCKKRKRVGLGSSSAAQQRPKVHKQQQQLRSLLRSIKTWLIQAKFAQITSTNGQSSNDMGEAFIMTEDERTAFAKTMVKSCQRNEKLRTLFLESVRVLTMSGLMHATATTLLQEETCEEAQTLMDAWAEANKEKDTARPLPMNLLKAVNQVHEMRGDLSTKLTTSEDTFGLKRLDEKTWKFNLPTLPQPKPTVPKNSG